MKLHNEWMTNNNLFNENSYSYSNSVILQDTKETFDLQRNYSLEGFSVDIDNNKNVRVVIQKHNNPINADKEDRILLCPKEISIHRGSIIVYEGIQWLVTSEVKSNGVYKTCGIEKTNHTLKFYNELSRLISVPVIAENKTLWTLGVSETAQSPLITGDAKLNITMPDIEDVKCIDRDTRLICDDLCWKVTIRSKLKSGLITLVCGETEEMKGLDDMVNEIPANPYAPITITFPQPSYTINANNTIQLTPTIKQGDEILLLSEYPVTWSVDNQGVASVSDNGLVSGISTGSCKVICALKDNPNVFTTININVSSNIITPSYTYVIEGNNKLSKTATNTYVAKYYDNSGIEVTSKAFDFRIANYNNVNPSDVLLTVIDDRTIKIKNIGASSGSLYIIAQDRNSIYYCDKDIQLTGIYG